ncbi:MAG: hydrogenase expression/formation protein HypE, partial [Planctomycetes bacterium]|nr:hydrogenase expression/formation protein HypE [Planctomycetota bacterium]
MTDPAAAQRPFALSCPAPLGAGGRVLLGHGGGGSLGARLLAETILPALPGDPAVEPMLDGATFAVGAGRLCMTTDSFVVQPIFFPGGDIGSLAVHGTVNDIAMCGGAPRYLSLAFILEEGFPIADLERVAASAGRAARACGVAVVTGDTKVVERGKGDGVFINTTGIGVVPPGVDPSPRRVREGDRVILSGPVGLHGMAVMGQREGFQFASEILSDSAPLHRAVQAVLERCPGVRCLRDPTRGGLASALDEIAEAAGLGFRIREDAVPVPPEVRAACEILGLDPLYVANEGKMVLVVDPADAADVLAVLRELPETRGAVEIGRAARTPLHGVVVESALGGERILDRLSG